MHSFSLTVVCSSIFSEGEKIKLVGRNGDMEKWIRGGEALWKSKRDQNLENYGNEITTINMLFLACGEESFLVARGIACLSREVSDSWSLTAFSRMNALDVRNTLAWKSICATGNFLCIVLYSTRRPGAALSCPGSRGRAWTARRRRPAASVFVLLRMKCGSMPNPGLPCELVQF